MECDFDWKSGFAPEDAEHTFAKMLLLSDDRLESVMTEAGLEIEKQAKQRAPVDTGNLKGSLESETRSLPGTIKTEVGTNVHYAPHVEYGTSKMAAQPFLRPAYDDVVSDLEREIRKTVYEVADKAGGGL